MKASIDRDAAAPGPSPDDSRADETRFSAWPGVASLRRAMYRHPTVTDGLLVAVLALGPAVTLGFALFGTASTNSLIHDIADLAGCLALFWRRRRPVGVLAAECGFTGCSIAFSRGSSAVEVALLVGLYTVAAYRPRRVASGGFVALEIGMAIGVLRWEGTRLHAAQRLDDQASTFAILSCLVVTAFVLGVNMRTRRQYLASLQGRAERAERERDQQAQLAAASERAHIAREMHDIVAHNLSVMIALADGAAFAIRTGSAEAEHAARKVSDTGRQALSEMRRLLGVLRDDDHDGSLRAPQPGIAAIDDIVGQVRAAGLAARLAIEGEPFDVPQTAQLAVFRLVQESLTNVLKHAAGPSEAYVRLRYDEPAVSVEVVDDGGEAALPTAGGGHGLTGMRERAAMFGGTVSAGPRPGGGWRVAARFDTARGSDPDDGPSAAGDARPGNDVAEGAGSGSVPAGRRAGTPRDAREERVGSR